MWNSIDLLTISFIKFFDDYLKFDSGVTVIPYWNNIGDSHMNLTLE